jgi:hypothetical protein
VVKRSTARLRDFTTPHGEALKGWKPGEFRAASDSKRPRYEALDAYVRKQRDLQKSTGKD